MQRVKKSVLVPFSADAMFELVDRVERYPRVPAVVRRARACSRRTRRQDRAHRHRLPRRPRAFHDRQRQRAGRSRSWSRCNDGPFRHLHGEWRFRALRRRRLQGRVRARLRVRDARARAGRRPGVRPHRQHVHRRVRAPRRGAARGERREGRPSSGRRPASRTSSSVELPDGATVADAVARSRLVERLRRSIRDARASRSTASARAADDAARRRRPGRDSRGRSSPIQRRRARARARCRPAATRSPRRQGGRRGASLRLRLLDRASDRATMRADAYSRSRRDALVGRGSPARVRSSPLAALRTRRRCRRTAPVSLARAAAATVMHDAAAPRCSRRRTSRRSALGLIGIRYRCGGDTPTTGLDCSGLVRYVFQQVTGVTLPRTAKDMSRIGEKVAPRELQPGDLVFFNTRRFAFSHVGIYLGDNRFIHAPLARPRGRDRDVRRRYWQKRFNGARRLVGVLPELMPALVGEAVAAPLRRLRAAIAGATRRVPDVAAARRRTRPTAGSPQPLRATPRAPARCEPLDQRRVVAALRPVERARAVLVAEVHVRAARDQQVDRRRVALRAPPSSAPSCRSATPR